MEQKSKELETIVKAFLPACTILKEESITTGIINNTYHIQTTMGDYLLQRINTNVFSNPEGMMANIEKVTSHLQRKNAAKGLGDERHNLTYEKTKEGKNYLQKDGEYWRLCNWITNSITLEEESSPSLLKAAGKAFGSFAKDLADLDCSSLTETIPDFHNTDKRINDFYDALSKDAIAERVHEAQYEINVIAYWKDWLKDLSLRAKNGTLPLRITHNDTKTNNILFDKENKEFLAVIDLDTVMPGLAVYDLADAIRYSANTAKEDEIDTDKASLDLDLFQAFVKGYLAEAKEFLTVEEKETLAKGIVTIVFEQGIRFLQDYITGDHYYQTTREKQNYDRARCQFRLFEDMMAKYPVMERIIREALQ